MQAEQAQRTAVQKAFDTLLLVLSNIVQQPHEQKFRTLKLSNPKIQDMFSTAAGSPLRAVLETVGKLPSNLRLQIDDILVEWSLSSA